jgi:hypothetical protein
MGKNESREVVNNGDKSPNETSDKERIQSRRESQQLTIVGIPSRPDRYRKRITFIIRFYF